MSHEGDDTIDCGMTEANACLTLEGLFDSCHDRSFSGTHVLTNKDIIINQSIMVRETCI